MDAFARLNPIVIFGYYVMGFFLMLYLGHPFVYAGVFFLMFLDYVFQKGFKKAGRVFLYSMGAAVLCLVINPLLNHRGVTELCRLGDMRITREAMMYGANMAALLLASLMLFSCLSMYMTSEKIMTLFGKTIPTFSLLFSMILGFIPRAARDFRSMVQYHGSRPAVWSALLGMSMEEAMERSLSMKSREYGREKRTSYYRKKMQFWEKGILVLCLVLTVLCVAPWREPLTVRFFPSIQISSIPLLQGCFGIIFYSLPLILRGREEIGWLISRQKIIATPIRSKKEQHLISKNCR